MPPKPLTIDKILTGALLDKRDETGRESDLAISPTSELRRVLPVTLHFTIPMTIRPGQPIAVVWSLTTMVDVGKQVSARLLFDGSLVRDLGGAPVVGGAVEAQTAKVIPPAELGPAVYRVGYKHFVLEVKGDGDDAGPWKAKRHLWVVPEKVDSTWWQWTCPTSVKARWKRDHYTIRGRLTNRAAAALSTVRVELWETEMSGSTATIDGASRGAMTWAHINPGSSVEHLFGEFSKDWEWFVKSPPIDLGPRSVDYSYAVKFVFDDVYGNHYAETRHPPLWEGAGAVSVEVRVEDKKVAAAGTAILATATAITTGAAAAAAAAGIITIPLAAGFAAAAVAASFVAGAAIVVALDPPEPDPRFLRVVPMPEAQRTRDADPAFRPILDFLASSLLVLELENTLSRIEARLLGARMHGSGAGVALQGETYRRTAIQLMKHAAELPASSAAAAESLASLGIEWSEFDRWAQLFSDLSPEARREFEQMGLSLESMDEIERFASDPSIKELVDRNGPPVELLGQALAAFGAQIAQQPFEATISD